MVEANCEGFFFFWHEGQDEWDVRHAFETPVTGACQSVSDPSLYSDPKVPISTSTAGLKPAMPSPIIPIKSAASTLCTSTTEASPTDVHLNCVLGVQAREGGDLLVGHGDP